MKFSLAPMEGVVDANMRHFISQMGGMDECVTEFLRVTNQLYPKKVFHRICPELETDGRTASGVPVILQLLGGDPIAMADNAARGVSLGAPGIDLNFGCPSKTVNGSDGGAALLQYPDRIFNIISAVREAVPTHIPVTAKIRLGFADSSLAFVNAEAVQSAGAAKITVHGRTKVEGYKPPADWDFIGRINDHLDIPVVANGDIVNIESYEKCAAITGCTEFMIGRGLLANPGLIKQLQHHILEKPSFELQWQDVLPVLKAFQEAEKLVGGRKHQGNRIKQWLVYLRWHFKEAGPFFDRVKVCRDNESIINIISEEIMLNQ